MKIKKYIDWYKTFPVKTVTPEEFREIYERIREKGKESGEFSSKTLIVPALIKTNIR